MWDEHCVVNNIFSIAGRAFPVVHRPVVGSPFVGRAFYVVGRAYFVVGRAFPVGAGHLQLWERAFEVGSPFLVMAGPFCCEQGII